MLDSAVAPVAAPTVAPRRPGGVASGADEFFQYYVQGRVLGRGVSSVVYLCTHKATGEEFAVKIIDKSRVEDADAVRNEVACLRALGRHPNIIHLRDEFDSVSATYLVFELALGGELFDQLTKRVYFSERHARAIMRQLLSALMHIHTHGYVHRDLKPENILLTESGQVKIADFGLAIVLPAGAPLLHEVCGTPGYMAPEVIECHIHPTTADGYGRPVDLWACGVIMYTLLVGFPPFWSSSRIQLMRMIRAGRYSFVSTYWDHISVEAKDLISKLLVVDPRRRLTVDQALDHAWILGSISGAASVAHLRSARSRFKAAIYCVASAMWLRSGALADMRHAAPAKAPTHMLPPAPPLREAWQDRRIRRLIDKCAFQIYAHWVKKSNDQDRAALFENTPQRWPATLFAS